MAHMTVVFWERTSVRVCRNVIAASGHRIVGEHPHSRRFVIEVPAGQEWAWAPRYKSFTAVRAVFYECERAHPL